MISLDKVELRYPGDAFRLSIPHLTVDAGEKLALIGPSGSGKTSLINAMAGIILPDKGTVRCGGNTVNTLSDAERRQFRLSGVGLIFQDFGLIEYLSVLDNVLLPYRINRVLTLNAEVIRRARQLAQDLGVATLLSKFPATLSQGEKQRVAICRALLPQPRLILADEATGNLDPDNKIRILELLFHAVEQHKATLIAVTHDHALLPFFDRVVDMTQLARGT